MKTFLNSVAAGVSPAVEPRRAARRNSRRPARDPSSLCRAHLNTDSKLTRDANPRSADCQTAVSPNGIRQCATLDCALGTAQTPQITNLRHGRVPLCATLALSALMIVASLAAAADNPRLSDYIRPFVGT